MKIKEITQRTGLTKKTVRFYEAAGLFEVETHEQGGRSFRDYSEENVRQLLDIATLRRARFSVEEIRRMKEKPEETGTIFQDYRIRLREELWDLADILSVAETIDGGHLTGPGELIEKMKGVASNYPLPAVDIHPRFRYLDELEDLRAEQRRERAVQMEKKRREDVDRALIESVSTAAYRKGCARDLGPGNEQKFAILQMLQNDKE